MTKTGIMETSTRKWTKNKKNISRKVFFLPRSKYFMLNFETNNNNNRGETTTQSLALEIVQSPARASSQLRAVTS